MWLSRSNPGRPLPLSSWTTRTEAVLPCNTFRATLPRTTLARPVRPREPITTRSAPTSATAAMISAAASPVRRVASACRPRARSRAVVSSAMRVCSALASATSFACASITWRYMVGAIPVCHGSTTSATLTTWIGSRSKIGHVESTASAAAEGTEPSVAKMTRLDRLGARNEDGAWRVIDDLGRDRSQE